MKPFLETPKKMTENPSPPESKRYPPARLFLETSAHILRLQGPEKIQKGIRDLINTVRATSGQLGMSAHVEREFYYVVDGFFDEVQSRIALLTDPETDRPIEELWREVRDIQMPMFFLGGDSLLDNLGDYLVDRYHKRLMRPRFLDSIVSTFRHQVTTGFKFFKVDEVFDKSTCEVWDAPRGSCSSCDEQPTANCTLSETCVDARSKFIDSLTIVAGAGCKESKWLKANLQTLQSLEGKALQEFIGTNPDKVGDTIIFWEVPDGWTILSRDKAFQVLTDKQRNAVGFYMVRIPRNESGKNCTLRFEGETDQVNGILDNYNSKGARVHAAGMTVRENQQIDIECSELSLRTGKVTKFQKPLSEDEAQRNELRPTFGLKFIP